MQDLPRYEDSRDYVPPTAALNTNDNDGHLGDRERPPVSPVSMEASQRRYSGVSMSRSVSPVSISTVPMGHDGGGR